MDVAPWRHEGTEVHVECETVVTKVSQPINHLFLLNIIFTALAIDFQLTHACPTSCFQSVARFKRPPGWSPLRIMPERTKVKESSEESKESIITTQRTPLNCPTKPWKEFKPVIASIAPPNTTESSLADTTAAGSAFNDQDLIS